MDGHSIESARPEVVMKGVDGMQCYPLLRSS